MELLDLLKLTLTSSIAGGVVGAILAWFQNRKLEELKVGFQSRLHVHARQFDKEMEVYEAVWANSMRCSSQWKA